MMLLRTILQFTGSGGEADYVPIEVSISFTFTIEIRVRIEISRDNFTELREFFRALLRSVFLSHTAGGAAIELTDQESARLILNPDTATVNILDDDGK